MNGSPKNIQRDAIWTNPDTTDVLTWSTQATAVGATPVFNNSGSTNVDAAGAMANEVHTITGGNQSLFGVLMNAIPDDNVPYRVIASLNAYGEKDGAIVVGYADASPSGTDDSINEAFYIPFNNKFDGLIMVPYDSSYDGRAICFALSSMPAATVTAQQIIGSISVQCLGIKPPTMQNAVS